MAAPLSDPHQLPLWQLPPAERHSRLLPGETPAAALDRAGRLEIVAGELVERGAVESGAMLARIAKEIAAEARSLEPRQAAADYLPCDTEASDG